MNDSRKTLEIRHRLFADGDTFVVVENFGESAAIQWVVPTRELADALIAERKEMLMKLVASISKDAAEAVSEARHIDRMKSGRS